MPCWLHRLLIFTIKITDWYNQCKQQMLIYLHHTQSISYFIMLYCMHQLISKFLQLNVSTTKTKSCIPLLWKHCVERKLCKTRTKSHQSCIQVLCLHIHHRFCLLCFFSRTYCYLMQHHRHRQACSNWMTMQKPVNELNYRHWHPSYILCPSASLDNPLADPWWSAVRQDSWHKDTQHLLAQLTQRYETVTKSTVFNLREKFAHQKNTRHNILQHHRH